jgi:hypothetical protein
MRKMIAIGVGLLAVGLAVAVVVCDRTQPAEPPLRVGMTLEEVERATGISSLWITDIWDPHVEYIQGPDWLGNRQLVTVHFGEHLCVTKWEAKPLPRARPSWLEQTLNAVGWK